MKLYKVISKNNKAKDGGDFDYTNYLPKNNIKGKWLPTIENPVECRMGYHITPFWNMFISTEQDKVFEVEVRGLKKKEQVGVIDKYVCESIRLTKEIKIIFNNNCNTGGWNTGGWNTGNWNTGDCNTGFCNTGDRNTGFCNTGDWNTGDRNTGDWNTGNRNTGDWNTGNRNTGFCNTGNRNTGDRNTGNRNTGDCNTGNRNTGDRNTGNRNTGDWNTGNRNTGDWNTGNRNTGDWNTVNNESGFFNTIQHKQIRVFNKLIDKQLWDKYKKPKFIYFDLEGDYKESFIKSFKNTSKEDIKLLINLPNFDYKIFEEISGITKNMIENKIYHWRIKNGSN